MSNLRGLLRFILQVLILTMIVAGAILLMPSRPPGPPPAQTISVTFGIAATAAIIFVIIGIVIQQTLSDEEKKPAYNPLKVAQELSLRMGAVLNETELAAATAAIAEDELKVKRSAWLLLTLHEGKYQARPVPGKGRLPTETGKLSRNNPFMRQLDLQRKPIRQAALDAGAQFAQMQPAERDWLKQLEMEVYIPVFDAGLLTAIWMLGPKTDRSGRYRAADLELMTVLATQAGSTLKTARVIADLKQVNESMSTLNESLQESMDALAKMNAARSDFLAIASHELRTPITQLLGFADLLGSMAQDDSLDAGLVGEITGSIVRACGRLDEVISQMLEMAQLDAEAMDLNYRDTSIEAVLRQALEPYAKALKERRMGLSVKGIRSVPPIRADEMRLVRAFSQIISNAIKFTPDGGRIDISARLLTQDNGEPAQVEVVVADTGIGLDAKFHGLIFEKFYRVGSAAVHSTGTTKFMGAGPGLGLPVARGFIERHGGRIWVESPGHDPKACPGSRFYVVLPIRPPAFDPKAMDSQADGGRKKEVTIVPSKSPFVGME